eukprot:m.57319 g.57319  ORF g.57319 m.57319 type:complete len:74 (-) comp17074_c0_seq1:105-326(-)
MPPIPHNATSSSSIISTAIHFSLKPHASVQVTLCLQPPQPLSVSGLVAPTSTAPLEIDGQGALRTQVHFVASE